jgi:hypothetical protein
MSKRLVVQANEGAEVRGVKGRNEGPYLSDKVADIAQGSTLIYEEGPITVLESETSIKPISVYKVRSKESGEIGAVPVSVVGLHNSGWMRKERNTERAFDAEVLISDRNYEDMVNAEPGDIIPIDPSFMRDNSGNHSGVIVDQTYDVLEIEGDKYEVVSVAQPTNSKLSEPNQYKKGIPVDVEVRKIGY